MITELARILNIEHYNGRKLIGSQVWCTHTSDELVTKLLMLIFSST